MRLRKRRQFLSLYSEADRVHTPFFVLFLRANNLPYSRLGVTVSRKIGKPVMRNLIKRRLREIFRQDQANIDPPCDVVVNVKRQASRAAYRELRGSFRQALHRWEGSGAKDR